MAKTLVFRNLPTTSMSSVAGTNAELWVDTTKKTVVVMDGVTPGGWPLAVEGLNYNAPRATSSVQGLARGNNSSIVATSGILSLGSSITQSWTINQSPIGSLLFYNNGVLVFGISSSGAIVASGSVTSFGTPT